MESQNIKTIKATLGKHAALEVQNQDVVGLGTGSTAAFFVTALAKRVKKEQLQLKCVATSKNTALLAKEWGLTLITLEEVEQLDISVDGFDYIFEPNCLIKGAGGALLEEKRVEKKAKRRLYIADYSKLKTPSNHRYVLPIVLKQSKLEKVLQHPLLKEFDAKQRLLEDTSFFITDEGYYILDLYLPSPVLDLKLLHDRLIKIEGVIETGIFYNMATEIWIAHEDQSISKKIF